MKTAKEFLAEKKVDNYNHKCGLIYVPKVSALDAMEEYAQYKVNELNKSDVSGSLLKLLNKMDDEGRLTTPEQNMIRKINLSNDC